MTGVRTLLIPAILLLGGCASTPAHKDVPISSVRAVELANAAAPQRVPGTFVVEVRATDAKLDVTYLSSERDYRDQRNLAIVISAKAVQQLEARLGSPPADALRSRKIFVTGEAERVTIRLYQNGIPTNGYYYQTQLKVTDAQQIRIAD